MEKEVSLKKFMKSVLFILIFICGMFFLVSHAKALVQITSTFLNMLGNDIYNIGSMNGTGDWNTTGNVYASDLNATLTINGSRIYQNANQVIDTVTANSPITATESGSTATIDFQNPSYIVLANYTAPTNQTNLNVSFTPKEYLKVVAWLNYTHNTTSITVGFNNDTYLFNNYTVVRITTTTASTVTTAVYQSNLTLGAFPQATYNPRYISMEIVNNLWSKGGAYVETILPTLNASIIPTRIEGSFSYSNKTAQISWITLYPNSTAPWRAQIGMGSWIVVYGGDA